MATQAQLDSLNALITRIESGVSEVREGSRSWKQHDLAALYAERRRLQAELEFSLAANQGMAFAPVENAGYPWC